jgi:hypothetical protein
MTRWSAPDDDHDDAWDDDSSDNEPTILCPYCRQEMLEILPQCPHCARYLSEEDRPSTPRPWWVMLGAVLALAVACWWVVS